MPSGTRSVERALHLKTLSSRGELGWGQSDLAEQVVRAIDVDAGLPAVALRNCARLGRQHKFTP